ncbi:MAG: hypothetical protein ACYC7K_00465 [Desulfobacteria bacterium]
MAKGKFRIVDKSVWATCKALPAGHHREALVFLYFESGPTAHWTGLYPAPIVDISEHTRLTVEDVRAAIANLERWKVIVYDKERQLVCVRGMPERQLQGGPNAAHRKGIDRHLEAFAPGSPAVEAFNGA